MNTHKIEERNDNKLWKAVMIGGVPGILMGTGVTASAAVAADALDSQDDVETEDLVEVVAEDTQSSSGDISFADAFAAAREELGPGGVFEWNGNLYNTYTAEEWNSMDSQQQDQFAEEVVGEPDIEVYEVSDVMLDDGSIVTLADATIDGQEAVVADLDNDDVMDAVYYVDAQKGDLVENYELDEVGLTVDDMQAIQANNDAYDFAEDLYAGTPDYLDGQDTVA